MKEEKKTHYEEGINYLNSLDGVDKKKEFIKNFNFSVKISDEKDAKRIGDMKKYLDLPIKDVEKIPFNIINPDKFVLPKKDRLISTFAEELAYILKKTYKIFYRIDLKEIVEVGELNEENGTKRYLGFISLKPSRFITLSEKYITPGYFIFNKNKDEFEFIKKSMGVDLSNTLLQSPQLQDPLPRIDRIFNFQMPIMYHKKLTFPKIGYDKRFCSWLAEDSAKIIDENLSLQKSKEIIEKILKEFCFKTEEDKINAIAGLLTPFLRGMFTKFNTRTPVFFYEANRERAGKDYLAGITGIVYEGYPSEEPPISTGDRYSGSNEELRKKIMGALISGKKRLHFSNNKGYINNAVFESLITAEKYSDRILGKNDNFTFDNELELSLSGNSGVTYTPDLANRCRFIRLFLDMEDANKREFENPNLHEWILKNREIILSALYSLVRNWVSKGKPEGSVVFSSFNTWAKLCGGIMESAGYGSPCSQDKEIISLGGDLETKDMKKLFEICYEHSPEKWIKKYEIKNILKDSEEEIFGYYDFDKKSDQIKFGIILNKFLGRILSDIKLILYNSNERSSRQQFKFTKNGTQETLVGNDGHVGNDRFLKGVLKNEFNNIVTKHGQHDQHDQITLKKCENCENTALKKINGVNLCSECLKEVDPGFLTE